MEINDKFARRLAAAAGAALFLASVIFYILFSISKDLPAGRVITIKKGSGLSEISENLRAEKILRYPLFFKAAVFLSGGQSKIKAGDYFFEKPLSILALYKRLTYGIYGIQPVKVIIPEGWSVRQIGEYLEALGFFSKKDWLVLARVAEGYLFPDTYFFLPDAAPDAVIKAMRDNFDQKMNSDLRRIIADNGKNISEIIIMASIIEKEMNSAEDGRIISGILWKRIEARIGLQVDAALTYITGKPSLKLTEEDLATDSPYNTYKYRGLPPGPISNPGLDAIKAAIFPEPSPYWYYLHDIQGRPHYARDFEQHVANKQKYLR